MKHFKIAICLLVISTFPSCKKDEVLKTPINSFDSATFKTQLESRLSTARGYAFIITQNGVIKEASEFGIARIDRSDTLPMTINSVINIASVTKNITATAALRLISRRENITLDTRIEDWLPNGWTKNDDVSNITFRELLTHTSGIRTGQTRWSDLKNLVSNPLEGSKLPSTYANANFALFRALLPKMHNSTLVDKQEKDLTTSEFESWLSGRYIQIIQDDLFGKIDLQHRACAPVTNQVQMFNEAPATILSAEVGDWTETCGGGGFYMSTRDMARFIVTLTHDNTFLTGFLNPTERQTMDDNLFGWNRNFPVTGGQAFGHGGLLYSDTNLNNAQDAGEPGLQTLIIKFPNNVELALSINSMTNTTSNGSRNTNTLVQDSYNNSWVFK